MTVFAFVVFVVLALAYLGGAFQQFSASPPRMQAGYAFLSASLAAMLAALLAAVL